MPALANVNAALPAAPVVLPPTLAPGMPEPSVPSTTRTLTGVLVVAAAGPVGLRMWSLFKGSKIQRTSSPLLTFVVQPPLGVDLKFSASPQNWVEFEASPAIWSIWKSSKLNQVPSHAKPFRRAASSSAAVAVGTGDGNAPALVPSQGWGVPMDDGV